MGTTAKRCRKCRRAVTLNKQGLCPRCLQKRKDSIALRRSQWEQAYSQEKCYDDAALDAACDLANHFSGVSDWADVVLLMHSQLVRARREFSGQQNDTTIDRYHGQAGGSRVYSGTYRGRSLVMTQRS